MTIAKHHKCVFAFLCGLSLVAAACGPGPAASATAAPAGEAAGQSSLPRTTMAAPGFPDGVYTSEAYNFVFASGLFTLSTTVGQEWASGKFTVSGSQISFVEQDVEPECQPQESRFTYGWALNATVLAFTLISDTCSARQYFLPETLWTQRVQTP